MVFVFLIYASTLFFLIGNLYLQYLNKSLLRHVFSVSETALIYSFKLLITFFNISLEVCHLKLNSNSGVC